MNRQKEPHKVWWCSSSPYAEWRRLSGAVLCLNEGDEPPPERLLQAIWFHQRILRDRLRTVDGRPIRVLHPGFWNRERGPDFRQAMLHIDGEPIRSGDVEIDLHSHDWHGHGHDANRGFNNVVLHVVWSSVPSNRPTLELRSVLDSSLPELAVWLGTEAAGEFPFALRGECCRPLGGLAEEQLLELLHQAAVLRFHAKAAQFQARARQAGWEQAFWEGLFRALGYKQNLWPMHRLAELLPELRPAPPASLPLVELQARLLGTAGLLPDDLPRGEPGGDRYWRVLWDCWWRDRESFQACQLPRPVWRLSGQRPANHPHRRLALAAHWLADPSFLARIEDWCAQEPAPGRVASSLLTALRIPTDDFWSWHWTIRSPRLPKPRPLLGLTRATDLAVNVILPWLWMRAVEGKNQPLSQKLERRYFDWPPAEDNAVLRLARRRLLGRESARAFRSAAAQQGLIQIVRDYCEHADSLCTECRFPEFVRRWPAIGDGQR